MNKVIAIKEKPKGTLVCLKLDDKSVYTVKADTVSSLSISVGCELSENDFFEIKKEDENIRAYNRALLILSYSDNNAKELYMKLLSKGFRKESIDFAVKRVKELGYINEQRQLEALILRYSERELFGRYRIAAKLISKGYKSADIEEAFNKLCLSGELDFEKSKQLLFAKFKPDNSYEKQKLLYKYGYRK